MLVKRGAWGVLDQTFISFCNFVTTVFLARALSPESFGEFAVAFSFITVLMALVSAALTQPFVVLSARYVGDQSRRLLSSTFLVQVLVIAAVAIPIALSSGLAIALGWRLGTLIAFIIPAFGAWQLQEFIRQVFYTQNRLRDAFLNDVLGYGAQATAFFITFVTGVLTPGTGLLILALTFFVAAAEGVWLLRRSFAWSFSRPEFRQFMRETWDFGRWTLAHATIGAVTGFYILVVLATFSGPGAAGIHRAFVATTAPMRVLIAGARTSFSPSAAKIAAEEGISGLQPYIKHVFLMVGSAAIVYCILLALFARPVLNILFGGSFDDYAYLLPLFVATYFISEIFFAIEIGLRALRITDILFRAALAGAIALWILGPPVTHFFGLSGLLWLGLAQAPISGTLLWLRYQREVRKESGVVNRPSGAEQQI